MDHENLTIGPNNSPCLSIPQSHVFGPPDTTSVLVMRPLQHCSLGALSFVGARRIAESSCDRVVHARRLLLPLNRLSWAACSSACGGYETGTQYRHVTIQPYLTPSYRRPWYGWYLVLSLSSLGHLRLLFSSPLLHSSPSSPSSH